jgi:hypothetical protein
MGGDKKNVCKILVVKSGGERQIGRNRRRALQRYFFLQEARQNVRLCDRISSSFAQTLHFTVLISMINIHASDTVSLNKL